MTLHDITLHYITLHYITLHYIYIAPVLGDSQALVYRFSHESGERPCVQMCF